MVENTVFIEIEKITLSNSSANLLRQSVRPFVVQRNKIHPLLKISSKCSPSQPLPGGRLKTGKLSWSPDLIPLGKPPPHSTMASPQEGRGYLWGLGRRVLGGHYQTAWDITLETGNRIWRTGASSYSLIEFSSLFQVYRWRLTCACFLV